MKKYLARLKQSRAKPDSSSTAISVKYAGKRSHSVNVEINRRSGMQYEPY